MPTVNGVQVLVSPPEGYVVDFNKPQRQSVEASYVVIGVGIVISTFFMLQRLYVKRVLRNKLGVDDLLLVFAWIGSVAIQGLIVYTFHEVIMGVHVWEIPLGKFEKFAMEIGGYVTSIVYTVPTTLAKIVILLFYREIDNPVAWYMWSVNSMMFIVAGSGIAILLSSIFPCQPFAKSYDITLANIGSCINRPAMYQATAGLGVATDVLIFIIPIPMVIGLRMSASKKIGLIAMFGIGSATVITSMVRLALLISSLDDIDQTWGGGPVTLWICVEANLLTICASLPTIRHFFKAVAPQFIPSGSFGSRKTVSKTPSTNHELRTFGAGSVRNRAYYSRFDATDIGTDTIVNVQGLPPQPKAEKEQDRLDGDKESDKNSGQDDHGSGKGIVQTRTTHVYYEYL
ncbi:hypothetical protein QQS21_001951 [Conoideocrella luteorostrata]|uniref:Rhodopsin domain-containing protein n=1 Tax=Conoideocrella luteorostrata TaxID=1105319 RepID=A0AAJ0G358_9HYPO|nr:hypothetical protein QQS21_001951 [Conoideocrella luteorostrata]